MSLEYAEQRIKEAIKLHGRNNQAKVRQQIIAWTFEDFKLLQALAKPHLSGVVAYHVERVLSGRSEKAKAASQPAARTKTQAASKPAQISKQEESFGMEIMKAIASDSGSLFGFENTGAPTKRPGQVSQSHVDALRQMATKSKSKK